MAENPQIILLLIKLLAGFATTVSAVILWSRTREVSWLFVVAGTVFLYGEVIIETLELFGLTNLYDLVYLGIPVIEALLALLPFFFFTAGFISFLTGRRRGL
jgi:hypothetical protein